MSRPAAMLKWMLRLSPSLTGTHSARCAVTTPMLGSDILGGRKGGKEGREGMVNRVVIHRSAPLLLPRRGAPPLVLPVGHAGHAQDHVEPRLQGHIA